MSKKILNMIAKNAIAVAKISSKGECFIFTYRPKMPEKLKKNK